MKKYLYYLTLIPLFLSFPVHAENSPFVSTRSLSAELANQAALNAYKECQKRGYQVAVSVVDRNGRLIAFIRNPLAGPHTIEVSQRKAFTSATFQSTTSSMMDRKHLKQIPGVLLLGGGAPIRIAGHFYGALGVSGAPAKKISGDEDEVCANKGISSISEALEFVD